MYLKSRNDIAKTKEAKGIDRLFLLLWAVFGLICSFYETFPRISLKFVFIREIWSFCDADAAL